MSFAAIEILFFVCAPLLSFDYTQDFRETLNNRTNTSHQWLNMFCDYWYWDNEKTLSFLQHSQDTKTLSLSKGFYQLSIITPPRPPCGKYRSKLFKKTSRGDKNPPSGAGSIIGMAGILSIPHLSWKVRD